jgi:hypothetical protein
MRTSTRITLCVAALLCASVAVPSGVALGMGAPGVETYSPKAVTSSAATLSGVVDPSGTSSTYWFEYGTTTAYGVTTTTGTVSGWVGTEVNKSVTGLSPGTTYHVRLVASNAFGTSRGDDVVFTTQGTAPGPPASPPPGTATPAPKPTGAAKPSPAGDQAPPDTMDGSQQATDPDAGIVPVASGDGTPELGRSVALQPASGTVTVLVPGSNRAVDLSDAAEIPIGSVIDTRHGEVQLRSALAGGRTQSGTFHGGMFEIRQSRKGDGMTELVLRGPAPTCAAGARSAALRKGQPPRGLWGHDDHGRFRTRGSNSVATVRGTSWYVADTCKGTVTRVTRGAVSVQDLHAGRTVVVKAGHSYLAHRAR